MDDEEVIVAGIPSQASNAPEPLQQAMEDKMSQLIDDMEVAPKKPASWDASQYNIAGSQTQLEVVTDDEELFEMEVSEDDIEYYIEDEDGNELGFAVVEDGQVVEYFYAGDADEYEPVGAQAAGKKSATQDVLGKVASAAGVGAKAAGGAMLNAAKDAKGLAQDTLAAGKAGGIAAGASVVGAAALQTGKNIKDGLPDAVRSVKENASVGKIEETLGIDKEDLKLVGQELGEIAKGGAELAGEVKGLFDDLNETFDFSEYAKMAKKFTGRRKF